MHGGRELGSKSLRGVISWGGWVSKKTRAKSPVVSHRLGAGGFASNFQDRQFFREGRLSVCRRDDSGASTDSALREAGHRPMLRRFAVARGGAGARATPVQFTGTTASTSALTYTWIAADPASSRDAVSTPVVPPVAAVPHAGGFAHPPTPPHRFSTPLRKAQQSYCAINRKESL